MSSTQYTFGGNYDRGNAFWVYNGADGGWTIFSTSDLSSPINSSESPSGYNTSAFGFDKIVAQFYSSRPFVREIRSFDDLSAGADLTAVFQDQTQVESLSNNYPYSIGFGNGRWMTMPYRLSSLGSVTGDVRVSTNGNGWTTYSGVLPSGAGFCAVPVYNSDDGRWATSITGTTTILYSDDDGVSWSSTTAPVNVYGLAYGNGTWVFSANTAGVVYSSDNLSTLTTVQTNTNYTVHYNEWDQKFWLPAGFFTGSIFTARIYSSTDGISWTSIYGGASGTTPLLLQEIIGDDSGNYIGMGVEYSGGYVDTDVYLYSTDNGATWSEGTLPTARQLYYGINQMVWASLTRGTPPAGDPPLPTYSVNVNTTSVNENGDDIIWTINTTNIDDGTTLYWRLDPFPTDGYSDFTTTEYAGSITINGNVGTVTKTTIADSRTEGTDSVRLLLKVGGSGADDATVAESDFVTITDTSQTPPPPSRQHPTISSGSSQSGSVPATVLSQQEFSYDFEITNATPYSYTIDLKHNEDFLNVSAGDIFSTISVNPNTITAFNGSVLTFPAGVPITEYPDFDFSLRAEARNTSGTPDDLTFNISRTPFNQLIFPSSGTTIAQIGGPQTITIELSGGEPNSNWTWSGTNSGGSTFNSSGNDSVQYIPPRLPFTASWTLTWIDGTTSNYTLNFT